MTKREIDVMPATGETPRPGKPYSSPTLVRYGNISQVTRTVANKSATADGGMGSTDKTG